MISSAQRLLVGACVFAGRTVAFHAPIASSLSRHARVAIPSSPQYERGIVSSNIVASSLRRRVHSSGMAMQAGTMQETIEGRLTQALSPVHLEVINESHMHSGPAKESHFKVSKFVDSLDITRLMFPMNSLHSSNTAHRSSHFQSLSVAANTRR